MVLQELDLKIAITADPELPIPPKHYGGIERIIDILIRSLVARGHKVILFGNPSSQIPCDLIPYPGLNSGSYKDLWNNATCVTRNILKFKADIVHSFGRLAYLSFLLPRTIPKIMTYQRFISLRSVILGHFLSRGTLHFTSVARHLIKKAGRVGDWRVIYNGASLNTYQFTPYVPEDAPLVFLGRIEYIKGTHLAIEIAKRMGRKLIIAGTIEREHMDYYKERVAPHIDSQNINFIGPVDDEQKNKLLGESTALLMPVLWDDPCPVVLSEALACGTPVIGLNRGGIPEVVQNGNNGFVCNSLEEIIEAVGKIKTIDRKRCRQSAEERFSDIVIVDQYEAFYKEIYRKPLLIP